MKKKKYSSIVEQEKCRRKQKHITKECLLFFVGW